MYAGWFERVYPRLSGYGLWLRGGEINTLPPAAFDERDLKALFVRLSTYSDTGYSFTHQYLYQVAAGTEGVYPDLAYLPSRADLAVFDESRVPWLIGTQSKRGARDFDWLGISNSIVQELLNLPALLEKSGIPLLKSERLADPACPLVVLGGANALYSSVLWTPDPWVDAVFVGESDAAIRRLLEMARDAKRAGVTKLELLAEMESVPGVIQPERPRPTRKSFVFSLNASEPLEAGPVYYLEEGMGSAHLQISEGCPCFCSFCAESWDRKPYRERSADRLTRDALKMKAAMGLDSIELYSFNFNMHSGLYDTLWELAPLFRRVGLKSQRFDLLAHDPEMVEFQHAIEKASLTCGLEGISPRLRRYLHKNLETEDLHRSLDAIFRSRARELKVFLIATGLEEEEDFAALEDLLGHLVKIRKAAQSGTRVIFSMTPLVRFPWTPLEFEDAHPMSRYETIVRQAASTVRRAKLEFRESADLPEYWVSQVMIRAADERIGEALLEALRATGFLYYREVTGRFQKALEAALSSRGLSERELLAGFSLEESRKKPWSAIETGVKREFLWEEVKRARKFREIDYCLGRAWTEAKCFLCGGCPTGDHILDIVKARQVKRYTLAQFKERLASARRTERHFTFGVRLGERARGVPRRLVAVALSRALMLADEALAPFYRGFVGSQWGNDGGVSWVTGDDALTLVFREEAAALLRRLGEERWDRVNSRFGEWGRVTGLVSPEWRPSILRLRGFDAFRPEEYLKRKGLKHTLRKPVPGQSVYALTPQARRKGILDSLVFHSFTGVVELEAGPKLQLEELLKAAFHWEEPRGWARLEASASWRATASASSVSLEAGLARLGA